MVADCAEVAMMVPALCGDDGKAFGCEGFFNKKRTSETSEQATTALGFALVMAADCGTTMVKPFKGFCSGCEGFFKEKRTSEQATTTLGFALVMAADCAAVAMMVAGLCGDDGKAL
ncbi:hypothetical protein L1987_47339 [Smallanthus sonchifolius]|uniref:Uncharacterized protein n=1 Tax=Smallanthus sonchifolius TaxID=185202 RepID=A0ACB9G1Y3_9ASTR|nr:hypothetical protein L1987_47339 [Smallanthus sonchifolius]